MRCLIALLFALLLSSVAYAQGLVLPADFSGTTLTHTFKRPAVINTIVNRITGRNKKLLYTEKDYSQGRPAIYRIASMTKTFTAVLVLQEVEQGHLNLDSTLGRYLPEYSGPARNKVTIRQLLSHSSGIQNCEQGRGLEVYQTKRSLAEIVRLNCSGPLETEPGSTFSYNNGDYILLTQILEQVTGQSYASLLSKRILEPSGMTNTGLDTGQAIPGLIPNYLVDSTGKRSKEPKFYYSNWFGSGSMYSTVQDMSMFITDLFNGSLISAESRALMTTPNPKFWGHGFSVWASDYKGIRLVERYGSIQGSNCLWAMEPATGKHLIVLANSNAIDLTTLRDQWLTSLAPDKK